MSIVAMESTEMGRTALALPEGLTYEEWADYGHRLRGVRDALVWWWGDWLTYGERHFPDRYSQALGESDYSYSMLTKAESVSSRVPVCNRVQTLPWSHHREVAFLPPERQRPWLERAEREDWGYRRLHEELTDERTAARGLRAPTPGSPPAFATRYGTILADPPWAYGNNTRRLNGTTERHYPDMTTDELCAMPVAGLAADDSVLLLWTTWPMLPDALRVMGAWGFAYVTGLPWVKLQKGGVQQGLPGVDEPGVGFIPTYGVGFWGRGCSEPLLIGRRGNPPKGPEDSKGRDDRLLLLSPNGIHSKKPHDEYDLARHYPEPRLEMFARSRPPAGWDAYGDEAEGESVALAVAK